MATEFLNADLQVLMDQLRQKAHVMRSWNDILKIAKTNFMEKRNPLDAEDRAQLQQSLESLRKTVSVTSQKELYELLEEVCLRLGLKFGPIPASGNFSCCISPDSECFMMEIRCKENGFVEKIEIFFADKTQTYCPCLTTLMNERKWAEVEENLKSLASICLLTNDRTINLKIFFALINLEGNLELINKEISSKTPLVDLILTGPHGYFVPKEAGRLARLHYYISQYDLLNLKEQKLSSPNVADFIRESKGLWASLGVESNPDAQDLYPNPSDNETCKQVPAVFSLELNKHSIISNETLEKLEDLTGFKPLTSDSGNAVVLAAKRILPKFNVDSSKLFVNLPDQIHKYNMNSTRNQRLLSWTTKKIFFTNSMNLIDILRLLRNDAAYSSTLSSCIRAENCSVHENHFDFELSSPEFGKFEILFEHPYDEGFISVQLFCAADPLACRASLAWLDDDNRKLPVSDEFATKIFRKCASIPVTMRAIMKKLIEAKPIDKILKSTNSNSRNEFDDEEPMDFDGGHSNSMNFKENSEKIDEDQKPPNNDKNSGTKYWQSYDLSMNFQSKLIAKRYDKQKAIEFAMKFDEMALNQKLPNMLDLFKELDEWEELIPPRPGQKPLKSPAPMAKQRPQTLPSFPAPSPAIAPVTAPTAIAVQSTSRSPKMRHMSSTSDTYGELEQLLNLSKSFNNPECGGNGPGSESDSISSTPVSDRPAPILERKSSLQDTIDSVAHTMMMASNASAQQQAQMMVAAGMAPGPRSGNPVLMQSRSFDVDYMSTGQQQAAAIREQRVAMSAGPNSGMDVFDFDKNEEFSHSPTMQRWQSYSGEPDNSMQAASMGYNPDAAMQTYTQGQYALRGMLSAVGRAGTVRRRRQRRNAANVGDRAYDLAVKEMNKELRKQEKAMRGNANKPPRRRGVRRPRGGPGHMTTSHMMEMGGDGKMRVKFMHPGMSPDDDESKMMPDYQQINSSTAGSMQMPYHSQHAPHQQQNIYQQQHPQNSMSTMMALKDLMNNYKDYQTGHGQGQMSQGLDVEAEDMEEYGGAGTSGGLKDENLRRQIHAVVQETIYSEDPAFQQLRDREDLTGSASLDHRLMPDIVQAEDVEGGAAGGNLFDNLSARMKPGKRKGSLDDVIGKLTAGASFRPHSSVGSSESDEMGSSAFDTMDDYTVGPSQPKRIRLDDDDSLDEMPIKTEYNPSMTMGERKDLSQEILHVAKNEFGSTLGDSSYNPETGGQPIKLVIKKKDLKIPSETSMARTVLSNTLAKRSSDMTKLNQPTSFTQQPPMKRISPVNVDQSAKIGVQTFQKQSAETFSSDKKPSSKAFLDLKQRRENVEEKKYKKAAAAVGISKPVGYLDQSATTKMIGVDSKMVKIQEKYPLKSPKLEIKVEKMPPYVKASTPTDLTAIPGTEGILFSKSLAGYKIPKVDETTKGQGFVTNFSPIYPPQQPPPATPEPKGPSLQSPPRKPPFQPPPQTKLPKPILKHSHSTPPPPHQQQLQFAAQQQKQAEFKRRALLPDPPRFTTPDRGISAPLGFALEDYQAHYASGIDAQDLSRSPDTEGLVIDDMARSPMDQNLHNTSKDSDLSPGLRIDTESYMGEESSSIVYRPSAPEGHQSPEVT